MKENEGEKKKYASYDEFVREKLAQHVTLRHLFARLNTEVIVQTVSEKIRGILRSLDLSYRIAEIDAIEPIRKTFFVRFDYIVYIETEHSEKITGR